MSSGVGEIIHLPIENTKLQIEIDDIRSEFPDADRLCLHWASAKLYSDLPLYEEVALGGVGRIADDLALVRPLPSGDFEFLRAGDAFEAKIGVPLKGLKTSELALNFHVAFATGLTGALSRRRPALALAHCVESGLFATCEVLALPLASRWGGEFILVFMRQRPAVHDLVDAIYTAATDGILALAAIREPSGAVDFQVVSLNGGAAAFFERSESEILWKRLSEILPRPAAAALGAVFDEVVSSGRPRRFEHSIAMTDARRLHLSVSAAPIRDLVSVTFT